MTLLLAAIEDASSAKHFDLLANPNKILRLSFETGNFRRSGIHEEFFGRLYQYELLQRQCESFDTSKTAHVPHVRISRDVRGPFGITKSPCGDANQMQVRIVIRSLMARTGGARWWQQRACRVWLRYSRHYRDNTTHWGRPKQRNMRHATGHVIRAPWW